MITPAEILVGWLVALAPTGLWFLVRHLRRRAAERLDPQQSNEEAP